MKKTVLLSIGLTALSVNLKAQCSLGNFQPNANDSTICYGNETSISLPSTDSSNYYYLRNDANDDIIDGPLVANGSSLTFNTGILTETTTYNVFAAAAEKKVGKYIKLGTPTNNKSYVEIPNTPSLQLNENWTLEAWISPNGSQDNMIETYNGSGGYALRVFGGKFMAYAFNTSSNFMTVTSVSSATTGVWTHVAATFNETTNELKIYVNGILEATNSNATIDQRASSTTIKLGGRGDVGTPVDWFLMDEARIWNIERTEEEINYGMNYKLSGTEAGLMAYYDFNNVNHPSQTIHDLTVNNNNGVMLGWYVAGDVVTAAEQVFSPSDTCTLEMSQMVTVNVEAEKLGEVNDTICENESMVINGVTYDANNLNGTEIISNVGPNACDSTVTVNLNLNTIDVFVLNESPTLTVAESGASYQWIDCNNGNAPINNETNQTFTAPSNGNYAVVVTVDNCADTSDCIALTTVGINQLNNSKMTISPNPVKNILNLSTSEVINQVSIFDVSGAFVRSISGNFSQLDISDLSKGMYIINVTTDSKIYQKRFVKE